jgi:hypothetical protein
MGPLLRTPHFLSTILLRPELARYIETLAMAYAGKDFERFPNDSFDDIYLEIDATLMRACGNSNLARN